MAGLNNKINYIDGTKSAIKSSIESSGLATITQDVPFRQYADKISKTYSDIENKLYSINVAIDKGFSPIIKKEVGIPNTENEKTILTINGAGELHGLHLSVRSYINDNGPSKIYLKAILDNSFTFYIPLLPNLNGSFVHNARGAGFFVWGYFENISSNSPFGIEVYFSIKNTQCMINSRADRVPRSDTDDNVVPLFVPNIPIENTELNKAYSLVSSLKPIEFKKSLIVKSVNIIDPSNQATARAFYTLR